MAAGYSLGDAVLESGDLICQTCKMIQSPSCITYRWASSSITDDSDLPYDFSDLATSYTRALTYPTDC